MEAGDVIVIKFGGGLITKKDSFCTPLTQRISALASVVKRCIDSGFRVVVVHGAGSYGHIRSRYWRLKDGVLPNCTFKSQKDCSTQEQAVTLVRQEMLELNRVVCDALKDVGVQARVHPPHRWVVGTGIHFQGDVKERFLNHSADKEVDVTFGDVVPEKDPKKRFSILSGDDLVVRLSLELPNVTRLIFAIGGADGLLKKPPSHGGGLQDLIRLYTPRTAVSMVHNSKIDVTGGIGLKIDRGVHVSKVSKGSVDVFLVNGEYPDRVLSACLGLVKANFVGTRICGHFQGHL